MWSIWCSFCAEIGADPLLQCLADPIPILQVFALRYRRGIISASGAPTQKRQVEEALRSVGQALAALGLPDPRFARFSTSLDFRLKRQLAGYQRLDPPPQRVKPVPLPVLRFAVDAALRRISPIAEALSDLIVLAFFYLLRPGEYAHSPSPEAAPFRLQDVHLFCGAIKLNTFTTSFDALHSATFSGLEFTNQKNGVRGEVIGLGKSARGDRWCPVGATVRRVIALRQANAPPSTPLHAFWQDGRWCVVASSHVTEQLRLAVRVIGSQYGLQPSDISARSLRCSGAMALLCASVDTDIIRLIGRWRSDEMFRYLHTQAAPLTTNLSRRMVDSGSYVLVPNTPHAQLVQALV